SDADQRPVAPALVNFSLSTEKLDAGADYVVSLGGEVDLYTAPELKQELHRLVGEGASRLVIDMSETTFIDSTTLGVLLSVVKRGDDREAHLVLSEILAGLRRELRDRAVEAEALAGVGDLDGERVAPQLVANADHPRPAVRVGVTNRVRARLGDRQLEVRQH